MKTETKPLTFYVEDVEQLKELYPDFAIGKMKANELGSRIVEALKGQKNNSLNADGVNNEEIINSLSIENEELNKTLSVLNEEIKTLKADIPGLKDELKVLKEENALLKSNEESQSSLSAENNTLKVQLAKLSEDFDKCETEKNELQKALSAHENRIKELKAQVKSVNDKGDSYVFTPFFKRMVAAITENINKVSGTSYTETDVITQTLFATYFNSHNSIKYTYPITKEELLDLAHKFYPDIADTKELFEFMIHKI